MAHPRGRIVWQPEKRWQPDWLPSTPPEQEHPKPACRIGPELILLPSPGSRHVNQRVRGMFITVLRVNRLAPAELDVLAADAHGLITFRNQVHFDPACAIVPRRLMPERGDVKSGARLS